MEPDKIYIDNRLNEQLDSDNELIQDAEEVEKEVGGDDEHSSNTLSNISKNTDIQEDKKEKLNIRMKYPDPVIFGKKCEEYFKGKIIEEVDKKSGEITVRYTQPLTINGLALWLGFYDSMALLSYAEKDEFAPVLKKSKTIIYNYVESLLLSGKNTVGAIFWLKCNASWRDGANSPTVNQQFIDKPASIQYVVPQTQKHKEK